MVQRQGGIRRKSRYIMKKNISERGKTKISNYLKKFEIGDKVVLFVDSAYQSGVYHRRYHGKCGIVAGQRGKAYLIEYVDGKKKKTFIVNPIHLKKL